MTNAAMQPTQLDHHRPLLIGDIAPDFACRTTRGERTLADYRGRWLVLFSHPADFTPVCTSEFVAFARAQSEFAALDCDLLALSVDSLFSHMAWVRSIKLRFGIQILFPIIEDPSMAIARAYGMIHDGSRHSGTVRACFIIDPVGLIRLMLWYPMSVGRSVAEILRSVRALQASDAHHVLMPEGWQPGDEVIDPATMALEADDSTEWLLRTRPLETAA